MAQVRNLPLYSSVYVLVRETYRLKTKLPKSLKHEVGSELFASAIKILKCVVLANRSEDKGRFLSRLVLELEVQWVLHRLLFDLRGISEGEFRVVSERLTEIGKQSRAWQKWDKSKRPVLKL